MKDFVEPAAVGFGRRKHGRGGRVKRDAVVGTSVEVTPGVRQTLVDEPIGVDDAEIKVRVEG